MQAGSRLGRIWARGLLGALAALMLLPGRAEAWIVFKTADGTGEWNVGGNWYINWSGGYSTVPPTSADAVFMAGYGGNTVSTCTVSAADANCASLTVGAGNAGAPPWYGVLIVTNERSLTVVSALQLGGAADALGSVIQAGGQVSAGSVSIGHSAGSRGTYRLDSGVFQATQNYPALGNYGTGAFTQNGGTSVWPSLTFGYYASGTGLYTLAGGVLSNGSLKVGRIGHGHFVQSGGTNLNPGPATVGAGDGAPGNGLYEMQGGVWTNGGKLTVGGAGAGQATQTAGRVTLGGDFVLGEAAGGVGQYALDGGLLELAAGYGDVGVKGAGTFTQNGGTSVWKTLIMGYDTGTGTYTFAGGVLSNTLAVHIGRLGSGTFILGDSNGSSGVFAQATGFTLCRDFSSGRGTLRGWGTIPSGTVTLGYHGFVTADGHGTDRTLDLSGMTVTDEKKATAYGDLALRAVNRGKLLLKPIAVATGTYYWPGVTNAAINSMKLVVDGGAGSLSGALLATDHGGVVAGLEKPIGVWDFSGATFSASCALTIRYDANAAASQGAGESALKVFQQFNGRWREITAGNPDTVGKTITANLLGSSFSQIAVSAGVKATGTVIAVY
ncbi:MAG: hypothetical protein PHR35_19800 [Kiritimatiellae bacterium]|nr:hypothetical protein [Kiritimatiellia bacterium]